MLGLHGNQDKHVLAKPPTYLVASAVRTGSGIELCYAFQAIQLINTTNTS